MMPIPRLVAWELTRRCNLKCAHCRASAGEGGANGRDARSTLDGQLCGTGVSPVQTAGGVNELSFDEAKAVVDDIASFAKPILILTGGEPLLCPYLFELIAYAKAKGLKPVIGTNATLIDDALAKRIAAAGVPRISVSIDFPTAAEHDDFRGVKGAFEATLRGIRATLAAGVEVQVNSTITKMNRDLLPRLHDLAAELGAKAFHPFLLVPTGRGKDLADVELSADEYESALGWVCERQRTSPLELKPTDAPQYRRIVLERTGKMPVPHGGQEGRTGETPVPRGEACCVERASRPFTRGCLAGTGFCFISHVGGVQPCGYFDLQLGNVREKPLSAIWRESPVFDDLRHPERLKGKCGVCEYRAVCGGCRARAFARTGDYLAQEPYCAHVPEARLIDLLQSDFPLVERPYAALGERLGLSEAMCFGKVKALVSSGIVRRIGASFDSRRLGYVSTLVALAVPPERLDAVAAQVGALPNVTHNYSRDGRFNLWFTLIARSREEIEAIVREQAKAATEAIELPAEKTYKLRATFGGRTGGTPVPRGERGETCGGRTGETPVPRGEADIALVRKLQGNVVDLGLTPFAEGETARIRELLADGTIRRFGAMLDHRSVGFTANALTAWTVDDDRRDALGEAFARRDFVSHCYARRTAAGWPHSVYAMVHARSRDELKRHLAELTSAAAEATGAPAEPLVLETLHEYTKRSMRYFEEGKTK